MKFNEFLNENDVYYRQLKDIRAAQEKYDKALNNLKKVVNKTKAEKLKKMVDELSQKHERLNYLLQHFDVAFGDVVISK